MHEAIACDLRDDRRGGDRCAGRVTFDDRALRASERGDGKAVAETDQLAANAVADAAQGVSQRRQVGLVQAPRVDPADTARDDDHPCGARQHERIELLAGLCAVLLGVVERTQRAQLARRQRLVVEQHRGRDQRPGEAASPRLVGAGDEAHAERTVESEQAVAAAAAAGGSAHPGVARRSRCGREASRWRTLRRRSRRRGRVPRTGCRRSSHGCRPS